MMPEDLDDQTGLSRDPDPDDTAALERALGYPQPYEVDDDDPFDAPDVSPDHDDRFGPLTSEDYDLPDDWDE